MTSICNIYGWSCHVSLKRVLYMRRVKSRPRVTTKVSTIFNNINDILYTHNAWEWKVITILGSLLTLSKDTMDKWIVLVACCARSFLVSGCLKSNGVLLDEMVLRLSTKHATVAWIFSLQNGLSYIMGGFWRRFFLVLLSTFYCYLCQFSLLGDGKEELGACTCWNQARAK